MMEKSYLLSCLGSEGTDGAKARRSLSSSLNDAEHLYKEKKQDSRNDKIIA